MHILRELGAGLLWARELGSPGSGRAARALGRSAAFPLRRGRWLHWLDGWPLHLAHMLLWHALWRSWNLILMPLCFTEVIGLLREVQCYNTSSH